MDKAINDLIFCFLQEAVGPFCELIQAIYNGLSAETKIEIQDMQVKLPKEQDVIFNGFISESYDSDKDVAVAEIDVSAKINHRVFGGTLKITTKVVQKDACETLKTKIGTIIDSYDRLYKIYKHADERRTEILIEEAERISRESEEESKEESKED